MPRQRSPRAAATLSSAESRDGIGSSGPARAMLVGVDFGGRSHFDATLDELALAGRVRR